MIVPPIRQLECACSDALLSQHSVTSLQECLREVLENSIDAGASSITVRLLGCEAWGTFVVEDDGCGISCASMLCLLGTRYASSKSLSSLGYRGEALASIAQQARLKVVSRGAGSFETAVVELGPGVQARRGLCPPHSLPHAAGGSGTCVEVTGFPIDLRAFSRVHPSATQGGQSR